MVEILWDEKPFKEYFKEREEEKWDALVVSASNSTAFKIVHYLWISIFMIIIIPLWIAQDVIFAVLTGILFLLETLCKKLSFPLQIPLGIFNFALFLAVLSIEYVLLPLLGMCFLPNWLADVWE